LVQVNNASWRNAIDGCHGSANRKIDQRNPKTSHTAWRLINDLDCFLHVLRFIYSILASKLKIPLLSFLAMK